MNKKIGILGSGMVAKTLGDGFLKHGYEVKLGTRTTSKLDEWLEAAGEGASVGSFAEAAAYGDMLVLAVKGTVALKVLETAGGQNLAGKTILDAVNPIAETGPVNGVLPFFTEQNSSIMEEMQKAYPAANFVKAFSSVGSAQMVNPQFETKPSMFICGNDEAAKADAQTILDQFGWETEDMGSVEAARAIEPLCMLWCIPGFRNNQWTHAFKLLK